MPKKTTNYLTATPEQAKTAVIRYYCALKLECRLESQSAVPDVKHLAALKTEIAWLERNAPWLKQEVANAAC